jgi:putative ATP-dependent endonuclease of OLD family
MYLSEIKISNYKGIQELIVTFSPDINIIIGENGKNKTGLIDAIRILYNLGNQQKDINVSIDDFHIDSAGITASKIEFDYVFKGLSDQQKGAFYEYLVLGEEGEEDIARISLSYERGSGRFPRLSYSSGIGEGQKPDYNTFELFNHYYLNALRDCTRDLLSSKDNLLGRVIKRIIHRNDTDNTFKTIIDDTNTQLLAQQEVLTTKENINTNINSVFKVTSDNLIGLHIEQSNIDYIVNSIKPYLPHNSTTLVGDGFNLNQNSLGFNNIIYVATVLSDIHQRITDDSVAHFALLIEEPEAHLHPQLQLSLYDFLKTTNGHVNSQLFITTHSPSLTSKVKFGNLILLDKMAYRIENTLTERESESIRDDYTNANTLSNEDFLLSKKKLERYIDVTKSQLFFAKSILLIEGITEELLIPEFAKILGFTIHDYQIEIVNVKGTSFKPFLHLFNSSDVSKKLPKNVAVISDGDEFTESKKKEYAFEELIKVDGEALKRLREGIATGTQCGRISNLELIRNGQINISIHAGLKTFEFELCKANVPEIKSEIENSFLFKFIESINKSNTDKIRTFYNQFGDNLTNDEHMNVSLLLWKSMPTKAEFAQDFAIHIIDNFNDAQSTLKVPEYITNALTFIKS